MHDLGIQESDVLTSADLPRDLIQRSGQTISLEEFIRFWNALEQSLEPALLPICLAERATTEAFAPPLFAALCSENLVSAVERIIQYKRLMGPGGYKFSRFQDGSLCVETIQPTEQPILPQSLFMAELSVLLKLARVATRHRIRPLKVTICKSVEQEVLYQNFFGTIPTLGHKNALLFSREDAERRFLTTNHSMWLMFEPGLRAQLSKLEPSVTTLQRVRRELLELIPAGFPTIDKVARRLNVSRRTLQRQLSSEKTSYQVVLASTRSEE